MTDPMQTEREATARLEAIRQMAEKWHDGETLGDSTCQYRELEIHAYIAGHYAAASELRSLRDSLALARSHIGELRSALRLIASQEGDSFSEAWYQDIALAALKETSE